MYRVFRSSGFQGLEIFGPRIFSNAHVLRNVLGSGVFGCGATLPLLLQTV